MRSGSQKAFDLVEKGNFLRNVAEGMGVPITCLGTKLVQKQGARYTQLTKWGFREAL